MSKVQLTVLLISISFQLKQLVQKMAFSLRQASWLDAARELIISVTGIQEGDENFQLCLQFVASNFNFHNNLDICPVEVHKSVERLIDKMMIHSKLDKAAKLRKLMDKLSCLEHSNNNNLSSSNTSSSVLLFILRLSNSSYIKPQSSQSVISKLFSDEPEDIEWSQYLRDEDDEMAVSNFVDDLSDWSADESDENPDLLHCKIIPPKRDDSGIDISADTKSLNSVTTTASIPSPMHTNPDRVVFQIGTPTAETSSKELQWLHKNLMNPYWKGISSKVKLGNGLSSNLFTEWENYLKESGVLSVNDDSLFLTERQISREVLWLLQGEGSFLFEFDGNSQSFSVSKKMHMSHLTPKALYFFLDKFCTSANLIMKFKSFIEKVVSSKEKSCQTFEAYASSLNTYLNKLRVEISSLERIIIAQEESCSLNDIMCRLSPILDNLNTISAVHDKVIKNVNGRDSCRVKAVVLLSAFYDHLPSCDMLDHDSSLLSLFLDTCQPYFTMIDVFISKGYIEDPYEEFFLTRNSDVDIKDEDFWVKAYINHVSEESGCLQFLKVVTEDILIAGKSVEIMNMLDTRSKTKLEDDNLNIYQNFIKELNAALQPPGKSLKTDTTSNVDNLQVEMKNKEQSVEFESKLMKIGVTDPYLITNFTQLMSDNDNLSSMNLSVPDLQRDIWAMKTSPHKPLQFAISSAIMPFIKSRCNDVSAKLIDILKKDFNLIDVLTSVRKFYLMEAGDLMFSFYSSLFNKLQSGEKINHFSLNIILRDAVSYRYPNDASNISIIYKQKNELSSRSPMAVLDHFKLAYHVPWPVNMIITKEAFNTYNEIFSFLLQIKLAKYSLDQLRFLDMIDEPISAEEQEKLKLDQLFKGEFINENELPREQLAHTMHLLRSRLMHFIDIFHNYIMTRILHTTGLEIQKSLEKAEHIEEVMVTHKKYLDSIYKQCLCHSSTSILKGSIMKVLNIIQVFQSKWRNGLNKLHSEDIQKMEKLFMNCYQFLTSFLSRLVKQGSFAHLESLVHSMDATKLPVLCKLP